MNVFIGKINVRFGVRECLHHFIAQFVDALGKFAGQLLLRRRRGQFRAGVNQVGNGLGLGQVDASIEKGAAGEFARFGHPRAMLQHSVKHQLGRQQAAVAGYFDHVFAGERARGAHDD